MILTLLIAPLELLGLTNFSVDVQLPISNLPSDVPADAEFLKNVLTNDKNYIRLCLTMGRRLGAGATSSVYAANEYKVMYKASGVEKSLSLFKSCAVKIVHRVMKAPTRLNPTKIESDWQENERLCAKETKILTEMKGNQYFLQVEDGIGTCAGEHKAVLFTSPVADRLSSAAICSNLLVSMVNALQALHDKGYVHRDIRAANFLCNGNSAILIDLGFAEKAGFECPWHGHFGYASPKIVEHLRNNPDGNYKCRKIDDLHALVYTFYVLIFPAIEVKINELHFVAKTEAVSTQGMRSKAFIETLKHIETLWNHLLQPKYWQDFRALIPRDEKEFHKGDKNKMYAEFILHIQ